MAGIISMVGITSVAVQTFSPIHFNFKEYMKRIDVNMKVEVIQKTALLGTAKILRKVLSLYGEGKERPGSRGELL